MQEIKERQKNKNIKYQLKDGAYHLKYSEVKKILFATQSFRNRCLIKALFWLGLRREEARNLDIRDIDFERQRVSVNGKGGKIRIIPVIDDEFLSDLKHLIGRRTVGAVFLSSNKNKDENLSLPMINKIIRKVGESAKVINPNPRLKHINPHIFRHSIARYLKKKGFSAEWLQNFLGHSSYKTTMDMYGTLSIDEMQDVALSKFEH